MGYIYLIILEGNDIYCAATTEAVAKEIIKVDQLTNYRIKKLQLVNPKEV